LIGATAAILVLIVAAMAGAQPDGASASANDGATERTITLRGDRLTVRVTDVPLDEVIRAVTEPTQAELKGDVKDQRLITADFADVPLQDGLRRLLGEQNFVLTYREDGSLRTLTLLGAPIEATAESRIVKAAPTTSVAPATPGDILQHAVPVSGRLQEFLGGQPTATMQQLMDITLRQDDASLRQEAMRAGISAIDTVPDLRASVVSSLENADDQTLVTLLRNIAHDRAREIATQMATGSRTPQIRARGVQLLRTLNEPAAPEGTP
jgi:hypothetical protein